MRAEHERAGYDNWSQAQAWAIFSTRPAAEILRRSATVSDSCPSDGCFDGTGNTDVMRQTLECCHRGRGEIIIIGGVLHCCPVPEYKQTGEPPDRAGNLVDHRMSWLIMGFPPIHGDAFART